MLGERQILTRVKRNGAALGQTADFRMAKKEMKDAITRSNKLKWQELRGDLNNIPWGLRYKLVMKKLGTNCLLSVLNYQTMTNIVNALFPDHGQRADEDITISAVSVPLFIIEKLQKAERRLRLQDLMEYIR